MLHWANDFRAVFWVAVISGILAVTLLFFLELKNLNTLIRKEELTLLVEKTCSD